MCLLLHWLFVLESKPKTESFLQQSYNNLFPLPLSYFPQLDLPNFAVQRTQVAPTSLFNFTSQLTPRYQTSPLQLYLSAGFSLANQLILISKKLASTSLTRLFRIYIPACLNFSDQPTSTLPTSLHQLHQTDDSSFTSQPTNFASQRALNLPSNQLQLYQPAATILQSNMFQLHKPARPNFSNQHALPFSDQPIPASSPNQSFNTSQLQR